MINKIGKKGKLWIKDRRKAVAYIKANPPKDQQLVVVGQRVFGQCKDCKHVHIPPLQPDHKIKRSQGGSNKPENIDWVCNEAPCFCHTKRDNLGDPNNAKPKDVKAKKADWQKNRTCKHCKATISSLICTSCGKISK